MCSHHRGVPTFKEGDEAEGQRPSHQAKEQGQRDIQLPPVCGPALQTPHNTTYLPILFTAQDKRHAPSGLPAPSTVWTGVDFSGCCNLDRVFEPWISTFLLFLTSCGKVSPRTLEDSCTLSLYLGGPTFTVAPKLFPKPISFSVPWVTDASLAPSLFPRRHRGENKFW